MIKIITDESATMPKNKEVGIVNLKIIWDEEKLDRDLIKIMRETKTETSPKTSQPSVGDFKKAYVEAFKTHNEIICITLSSNLSGTYNSAMQAVKFLEKEKQDKVRVIDSFTVDAGHGLLVMKAFELVSKGLELEEVVLKLEGFKENVKAFGFAGDPKWLERSGRLSKTGAGLIRRVEKIGIRPLLTIKDGKVAVTSIKLKAKDKIEALIRELKGKEAFVAITHGDALETALELEKRLKEECPKTEVLFIDSITPVISCHLGPDGIVCAYFLKENDIF